MASHRLWLALALCGSLMLGASARLSAMPAPPEAVFSIAADGNPGAIELAQTQPAQPPSAPANPPVAAAGADTQAASGEPIGNVVTLTGIATVIRNKSSLPLHLRDDIFLNDTVQTSSSSALGITFNDATTFNLSADAKIAIDNYIYEDGGKQNNGIFDIGKGTVAFVAAAVAKTGDMKINTPTATLGIRGTTGLVEVPENAAAGGANNVNIKLYPDADGRVGHIDVSDRLGTRLGALTQGASGFTIRPRIGGARAAAVPLTISPQQAARDQGLVRQVHAAQSVGRQIVTEQRALRRANPNAPNRGNPPGTGPQRQNQLRPNQLPGQNRPGQPQPGAPNRTGQPQPRGPQQPAQPPRPGERPNTQPAAPERQGQNPSPQPGAPNATPPAPGVQPRQGALPPGAPGLQRPGPNRPAQLRPRPPAKGKGEKKKR